MVSDSESIAGEAETRLAVYGSLGPGRPNHERLQGLRGRWFEGTVRGNLIDAGWGAELGYPGLVLDPTGTTVDVQVLESSDLPGAWDWLDRFEGSEYRRTTTRVSTDQGQIQASIYVLDRR